MEGEGGESYVGYYDQGRPSLIRWAFELGSGNANLGKEHSRQEELNAQSKNPKERLRCIGGTERKPVCLDLNG